jgi:Na+-transporting methylmalonyl-CoA/oxaloacetate decarboxylase gamma subunit
METKAKIRLEKLGIIGLTVVLVDLIVISVLIIMIRGLSQCYRTERNSLGTRNKNREKVFPPGIYVFFANDVVTNA